MSKRICSEIYTGRLSKIYHAAIKYRMSLIGFNGTSHARALYLINLKKKEIKTESYYFHVKYETGLEKV